MFWDADTYELLTSMPSLGGYVYSAAASYLDPYKIVYGVGDNLIRVWNTRANDKPFETNLIWQGIKSKVTVVSFILLFIFNFYSKYESLFTLS